VSLRQLPNSAAVQTMLVQPDGPQRNERTQARVFELIREQDLWKKRGFENAHRIIMLDRMYISVL